MEIERKYLMPGFKVEDFSILMTARILQYYVSDKPEIRIRQIINDQDMVRYVFTYKGEGTLAREEHEFEITENDFNNLRNKFCTVGVISKTRYTIKVDGRMLEVDVYQGSLEGLITAEIEFGSVEAAKNYQPPEWLAPYLGEDVTENELYKNRNLYKISSEKFGNTGANEA